VADPVANIIGISFVEIATSRIADIQTVMDAVIAAETNILNPILKALFIIYIGRQFLLTMAGELTMQRFKSTVMRAGIIILLVTHNGQFVNYVRDPVFNKIPQAMSAMIAGDYGATTAGQPLAAQFDATAAKGDAIVAEIDAVSTHVFSLTDWINSGTAHFGNGIFQFILACIVGIWLLGQSFLAIILAMGLPLLCFEIFERTRGFVDQWISKLVGFVAFGFAASFVLAVQMQGMKTMFDAVKGKAVTNGAQAVAMLLHIVGNGVLDLLTMAFIPTVVGFGSGAVASLAAPSAMVAMRSLSMGGGAVGTAMVRAAGGAARAAGGGIRNAISRT
jgi:hypothetical protein